MFSSSFLWYSTRFCTETTFFNILINDIPKATSKFNVIMYADDTTLVSHLENFGPVNNTNTLEQELNKEISKVNTWLMSNKLLLNVAKSKFMIFFQASSNNTKTQYINQWQSSRASHQFQFLRHHN